MSATTLAPAAYSVKQVAELLPLSRNTIYRRIADDTIPSVRVGSRLCVPATWVDAQFGTTADEVAL